MDEENEEQARLDREKQLEEQILNKNMQQEAQYANLQNNRSKASLGRNRGGGDTPEISRPVSRTLTPTQNPLDQ